MVSHEHLAVKIALLSLINDLPEKPSIARFSPSAGEDGSGPSRSQDLSLDSPGAVFKRMPLKHELLAAQNLAFISAYSKNPLHVLALACHEIQDHKTGSHSDSNASSKKVMIRLAANTGTHDMLLKEMKIITKILQDEANDSKSFN